MTSLIAKLRPVARYGVAVFLAAVSCFSGQAITCTPVGDPYDGADGLWYVDVHCTGYDIVSVKVDAPGSGSGGGSCTNCTAMTPEQCQNHKDYVISLSDNLISSIALMESEINYVFEPEVNNLRSLVSSVKDEGRQFVYITHSDVQGMGSSNAQRIEVLKDLPQGAYMYGSTGTFTVNPSSYEGAAVGIYNYYNDAVAPFLDNVETTIDNLELSINVQKEYIGQLYSDAWDIQVYVSDIDCSACSSGSGGGGGSSDPSTPSGGCPCAEVLEAIKTILEDLRTKQNKIQRDVETIRKKVEYWDNYLKWIAEAVAPMGTNFIAAVEYKDLDGISFQMKTLDETLKQSGKFDFEEFGKLGWYSRVEYLLMSIAGVFSITNRPDDVDKDSLKQHVDDIDNERDILKERLGDVVTGFGEIKSSVSSFLSSSRLAFAGHSANGNVSLMTGWLGGHHLEFTIDSTVIDVARTVTSLFWTVGFAFVFYLLVFRGFAFVVSVFKFWIVQAQGFLK